MRGCHTKEDIHDEEVIIEVPLKCLITVEMGKETEVCSAPLYFAYFSTRLPCIISPYVLLFVPDWSGNSKVAH